MTHVRTLFLAKALPGPHVDGYVVRNRGLLTRLGEMGEVDLLAYEEGAVPAFLRSSLRKVVTVPHGAPQRDSFIRRTREALSSDSLFLRIGSFRDAIRDLCAETDYDIVWVGGWMMLQYVPDVRLHSRAKIVADPADDDIRSLEIDRAKAKSAVQRTRLWRDIVRFKRYEAKYLTGADIALYVSSVDAGTTQRRQPDMRIEVSQNGVNTDAFAPATQPVTDPVFVFEGTMSFAPNVEGAVHFVGDILPLIQAELPGAKVILVGRNPVPEVQTLASSTVEVTGTVDDVRESVLRGAIFVSPLLGGVGQKNKILQAWSMALPIVSTPISVSGLDARDGDNLLLAKSAPAFAEACVKLARSPGLRAALARSGRETALEVYSVKRKLDETEALIRQLLAGQADASGPTTAPSSDDALRRSRRLGAP